MFPLTATIPFYNTVYKINILRWNKVGKSALTSQFQPLLYNNEYSRLHKKSKVKSVFSLYFRNSSALKCFSTVSTAAIFANI